MKTFFLRRAMREKMLMMAFAGLALVIWAVHLLGRGRSYWNDLQSARAELAAQQVWLQNGPAIDAKAAAATKSLDPTKTLNPTRLVGELNTLASQAGLTADIGSQRTEITNQFAFHTVQMNFRRVDLAALLRFYEELSKRAPYIGLEQSSLAVDRANPGQLNASFRIGSAELSH
jgi:hypothetical protein